MYADRGKGTEKQYFVTDPHGNVVQMTDEEGKITKTYEYDSFWNEGKPDSKDENPFRYGGEYYDKETEEVYLRARYYEPAVGRFLTRDSYTGEEDEPESLHLYAYCYNNTVVYIDVTGNEPIRPQPLPTPKRTTKQTFAPKPQPGPAPPPVPRGVNDYTNQSFSEEMAELYLSATRWKKATEEERALAMVNYFQNIQKEKEVLKQQYKGKYITDQSRLASLKFGTSNMKNAGCELIAIYNAILLKNGKCSLSDIILKCELSGYTALTGQWGTNPYRIGKLITKSKMNYSVVRSRTELKMKKGRIYIVSFWNSRDIFDGIHTIAVKVKKKNKLESYNDEYLTCPYTVHGTFKKLLKGRPFIIGYRMRGKRK